jgi:transcriptional regulator with XRE-family HTH domain
MDEDTTAPRVGQAIRFLREGKNLSLRELSQSSSLSVNAISKIERGDNSPTVASLHKIASSLGVYITDFFTERPNQTTIFTPRHNALRIQVAGLQISGLGNGMPNQKLEPYRITIEPGVGTTTEPFSHSGEEFVHCLEGELIYHVGNEQYKLRPGDNLLYKASQLHSWENKSQQKATIITVFEIDQTQPLPHRLLHEG